MKAWPFASITGLVAVCWTIAGLSKGDTLARAPEPMVVQTVDAGDLVLEEEHVFDLDRSTLRFTLDGPFGQNMYREVFVNHWEA